jgi:hypothetical protein
VKQAAELMKVSERGIYMARKVLRLRPDLEPEIMAGRMSINEAHRLATAKAKPTSWDRLVKAWNSATDEDRERLVFLILGRKRECLIARKGEPPLPSQFDDEDQPGDGADQGVIGAR